MRETLLFGPAVTRFEANVGRANDRYTYSCDLARVPRAKMGDELQKGRPSADKAAPDAVVEPRYLPHGELTSRL